MRKNIMGQVIIEDFEFPNIGIGSLDGRQVEIKGALPGRTVEITAAKRKGRYKGRVTQIISPAENEIPPLCPNTNKCGGCTFQSLSYADEIALKRKVTENLFITAGIEEILEADFMEAPSIYRYRNKMEFSFGDEYKDGPLNLGLRNPGSYYEVCDGSLCNICDRDFNKITAFTKNYFAAGGNRFYHRSLHTGSLRHLVIRKGFHTKEILVNLVTSSQITADLTGYTAGLKGLDLEGVIAGVIHTVNDSIADVVRADQINLLYGNDYFYDKVLGLDFKIYPFSFFQTNTLGAETLYQTIEAFCGQEKVNTLLDLYCGTGTIAQILSKKAARVYGIEIVESAIQAARENAAMNGITNCEFIAGDVLKEVNSISGSPDIIILDPPREGIHPKAIMPIIRFGAEKIVYVSCKPSSLVRDLKTFLENGYRIDKLRIHDMFPRSYHVETVALLVRK